ncbi:hypothetical protein DIPPA_30207 [Diplonema papillatum]|nr:hypothetical protein DIPPA_30207 [Diplonema papillatum]|eukprot:gene15347-23464_t
MKAGHLTPFELTFEARWIHGMCILLTVGTWITTYAVSLWACKNEPECMTETGDYYMSDSINFFYGQNIGAFFLFPGVIFLLFLMLIKYFQLREAIAELFTQDNSPLGPDHEHRSNYNNTDTSAAEEKKGRNQPSSEEEQRKVRLRLVRIAKAGWYLSCLCVIGAIGVISWPTRSQSTVHRIFAGIFFACTGLAILCYVIVDHKVDSYWDLTRRDYLLHVRQTSIVLLLVVVGAFIVFSSIFAKDSERRRVSTAICECTLYFLYEVCLISWYPIFWRRRFSLSTSVKFTPDAASNEAIRVEVHPTPEAAQPLPPV